MNRDSKPEGWTKDVPTVEGNYRWRESDGGFHSLADVYLTEAGRLACVMDGKVGFVDEVFGEWCRLVPADEVEKAWEEAREWSAGHNFDQWHFDTDWNNSRAKRVMEGRE